MLSRDGKLTIINKISGLIGAVSPERHHVTLNIRKLFLLLMSVFSESLFSFVC